MPSIGSVSRLTLESRSAVRTAALRSTMARRWERDQPHCRRAPGFRSRACLTRCRSPQFLRSARAEYAACLDAVKRLAMARSDVAFTFDHDGRRALTLQPSEAPTRVAALLTHELDRHGIGIDCSRDGLRLTGVISLPTFNGGWRTSSSSSSIRGR